MQTDSYTEITNFMQGYIENEINFNRDGSCRQTCNDYDRVDNRVDDRVDNRVDDRVDHNNNRVYCRNHTICNLNYLDKNKTRCDGQIRSCMFIDSDLSICPNVSYY